MMQHWNSGDTVKKYRVANCDLLVLSAGACKKLQAFSFISFDTIPRCHEFLEEGGEKG